MEFQIGDIVECIDVKNSSILRNNKFYKIRDITCEEDKEFLHLNLLDNNWENSEELDGGFFTTRFKVIRKHKKQKQYKFIA